MNSGMFRKTTGLGGVTLSAGFAPPPTMINKSTTWYGFEKNAVANARKVFGKGAKKGVEFDIVTRGATFGWTRRTAPAVEPKQAPKPAPAPEPVRTAPAPKPEKAPPAKTAKPAAEKGESTVLTCAKMMARPGGASMTELCDAIGIIPHRMRSKIFYAKHKYGYDVTYDAEKVRYFAKAPAPKKG